jgi:GT2 family glycosyltransferase
VIITKDRHDELLNTLQVLKSVVTEKMAEIIVVEEAEHDMAVEGVTYIRIPYRNLGFGHARNVGLAHVSGRVICFLDDDCQPDGHWLDEMLSTIEDGADGVGGAILPQPTNSIGRSITLLGFPAGGLARIIISKGQVVNSHYISTGNCAIRSSVLKKIGRFKEDFRYGGEDLDFFERLSASFNTVYNPNAIVFHKQRENYKSIFFWFLRRGKADITYLKTRMGKLRGLLFPLRGSLALRIAVFCLLIASLGFTFAFWVLFFYLLSFYLLILYRIRKSHRIHDPLLKQKIGQYQKDIFSTDAWLIAPVTKMIMDLGCEFGKWILLFKA